MREAKAGPRQRKSASSYTCFYSGLLIECFAVLRLKLERSIQTKNSWDFWQASWEYYLRWVQGEGPGHKERMLITKAIRRVISGTYIYLLLFGLWFRGWEAELVPVQIEGPYRPPDHTKWMLRQWYYGLWLSDFTFTFHFHALEKEIATHSSVLAWRIPGTGEPGGLPSMGSHRVGHDWSDLAAAS